MLKLDTGGFFDNVDTHALIQRFGTPKDWVIYVGLGGTIDRTGVSWEGLVSGLLSEAGTDRQTAKLVVEKNGPVRAASMVEALIKADASNDEEALRNLRASIEKLLYGPHRFMEGKILDALARFAFGNASRGKKVTFVTPNYDRYLYFSLIEKVNNAPEFAQYMGQRYVLKSDADVAQFRTLVEDKVDCVHLHGLVDGDSSEGYPVLGEQGYMTSSPQAAEFLREILKDRNLLVVGSSLTDTSLVNALLPVSGSSSQNAEEPSRPCEKIAIQPLQSSEWHGLTANERSRLIHWNRTRLEYLGVEPIHPDFFIQVGQLISEWSRCIFIEDASEMMNIRYPRRYPERLESWWRAWSEEALAEPSQQAIAHQSLVRLVEIVRQKIAAPQSEKLKAELWVRWEPHASRRIALWASSTGTWPDLRLIRMPEIGVDSRYRAVDIFCGGAPKFLHAEDAGLPEEERSRWRTYFGMPIWLDGEDGLLPVGVITIASDHDGTISGSEVDAGAVSEANLNRLQRVIKYMNGLGVYRLDPDSTDVPEWIAPR